MLDSEVLPKLNERWKSTGVIRKHPVTVVKLWKADDGGYRIRIKNEGSGTVSHMKYSTFLKQFKRMEEGQDG